MVAAETASPPTVRALQVADQRAHLEQRLFAYSPANLWLTAAAIYLALIGLYVLAAALDGAAWIQAGPRGG